MVLDIQTLRDSWQAASEVVVDRLAFVVLTNLIASVAWRGVSSLVEPPSVQEEVGGTPPRSLPPVPITQWLKLIPCILVDAGGDASYLLPLLGEAEDAVWAPTSALILRQLFGSNFLAGVDFVKEALPFTDFIPLATIAWGLETFAPTSRAAKALGIPQSDSKGVQP